MLASRGARTVGGRDDAGRETRVGRRQAAGDSTAQGEYDEDARNDESQGIAAAEGNRPVVGISERRALIPAGAGSMEHLGHHPSTREAGPSAICSRLCGRSADRADGGAGDHQVAAALAASTWVTSWLTALPSARPRVFGDKPAHDLAHVPRIGRAGFGDRLIDERAQLGLGQTAGEETR